jgi:hypothetical protein
MSAKDLINWGELSRKLTGDRMYLRKNRIPKKYENKVKSLIGLIEMWEKHNDDKDSLETMGEFMKKLRK